MINNRQAGRRRGRGGQRPQGGSGGNPNSANRIDNRARGNASQLHEKYKALARDAQMQDDRVNTEYYLQFADHYFRVLSESRPRVDENRRPRDDQSEDFDDDESGAEEERGDNRDRAEGRDRNDGRERGETRDRNDNRDRDDSQDRNDSWNRNENRDRSDNRERAEASGNGRANGRANGHADVAEPRAARTRPLRTRDAEERDSRDNEERPVQATAETPAVEKRGRGRPRKEAAGQDAPAAIDADRLPPALSLSVSDDGEEKPRRRRGRPPASEAADSAS